jgi:ATP-dependent RNA helicase DDX49/DBP8
MELFGKRARKECSVADDSERQITSYPHTVSSARGEILTSSYNNSFRNLGLNDWICGSVSSMGYKKPTDIQRSCIPAILSGRDVLACAETGSGKDTYIR